MNVTLNKKFQPLAIKAGELLKFHHINPVLSKYSISLRTEWVTEITWPVLLRPLCSCLRCYHAIMGLRFDPFRLLLISLAGWLNQQQQDVIDYLQEENHVLREQLEVSGCASMTTSEGA